MFSIRAGSVFGSWMSCWSYFRRGKEQTCHLLSLKLLEMSFSQDPAGTAMKSSVPLVAKLVVCVGWISVYADGVQQPC
eukprot:s615_g40.t1